MKSILKIAIAAVAFALAACGGQAHATDLLVQVVLSPTETVNLLNARSVDLAPGHTTVVDYNGVTHTGAFFTDLDLTASAVAGYFYNLPGTTKYVNMTLATSVRCVNSASVIDWIVGGPQTISDGCAFADGVKAYSRR